MCLFCGLVTLLMVGCVYPPLNMDHSAVLDEGANMVSRTKERALDPLLVPALPALATPSICWLRSAAASDTLAQHPCSSTAVRATAGSSARASELSNLAPRLRPARRTVAR